MDFAKKSSLIKVLNLFAFLSFDYICITSKWCKFSEVEFNEKLEVVGIVGIDNSII